MMRNVTCTFGRRRRSKLGRELDDARALGPFKMINDH